MQRILQKAAAAFSEARTMIRLLLYSIGILALFGLVTATIPNPIFMRMMPASPLDFFFLATTALLGGAYLALPTNACAADGKAAGGTFFGLLAFACPICNKLLVMLLGYAALFEWFDPLRPLLGVVSIAALALAIVQKLDGKAC
ncbi:MAG: hypothetical protein AB1529_08410 [Candidatus Micrarchaeota archaeon]